MGPALRVCYLTFPPERYSGAVFHAFWLAEKLAAVGVRVEFLAAAHEPRPARTRMRGFDVHYVRVPAWLGSYRELAYWPGLAAFFRRHRFDVVHVHSCAYAHVFAALAARLSRAGSVGTVMQQGTDLAPRGRIEVRLHRTLLRRFDRVVPISDETWAEALAVGLDPARLSKIPIGVDVDRFQPASPERRACARARFGLPQDESVASYVGTFSERKNVLWLVEAWLASRPAKDGARLLLVGDAGDDAGDREMRAKIERRVDAAQDAIRWIPFVSEIEDVYAASDLFLLASSREGMPSVVTQAMASGLPVLSTPVAGVSELLGSHGERGRLFGFDDVAAFHAGLDALLGDPVLRRTVGEAAREHVIARCSLDRVAAAYLDLYRSVAGRNRGAIA